MAALALGQSIISAEAASCSFCNAQVLNNQKFYEDDQVIVLCDHKPILEGHCLVVPKRHVQRLEDLSSDEVVAMHEALKKLYAAAQKVHDATGYIIFEKNGSEAGQSVPHVHVHFLPRSEGDYYDIGVYARMLFNQFKSPLGEKQMQENVQAMASNF